RVPLATPERGWIDSVDVVFFDHLGPQLLLEELGGVDLGGRAFEQLLGGEVDLLDVVGRGNGTGATGSREPYGHRSPEEVARPRGHDLRHRRILLELDPMELMGDMEDDRRVFGPARHDLPEQRPPTSTEHIAETAEEAGPDFLQLRELERRRGLAPLFRRGR